MPRMKFNRSLSVLLEQAQLTRGELASARFAPFFEGCRRARVPGEALRDQLAGLVDALFQANLDQKQAFEAVADEREDDHPHVATLNRWLKDVSQKLAMASKVGVPGARELRSHLKLSEAQHLGKARRAIHVAEVLVKVRAAGDAFAAFGVDAELLAEAEAAVQALGPEVSQAKTALADQKQLTERVHQLRADLEKVYVQLVLAREIAGRTLGAELPTFDLSRLLAPVEERPATA